MGPRILEYSTARKYFTGEHLFMLRKTCKKDCGPISVKVLARAARFSFEEMVLLV
jgi:hypothetical protein